MESKIFQQNLKIAEKTKFIEVQGEKLNKKLRLGHFTFHFFYSGAQRKRW
jgi:hypothetical protein